MKLSQIDTENITDKQIDKIVYSGIEDNGKSALVAIVFGNYRLQDIRIKKAVELYQIGRIKKLLLLGGTRGISNTEKIEKSEAICMKELAMQLGVLEEDIFVEETSNNSIENCIQAIPILKRIYPKGIIDSVILISSHFHLRRCLATFKKYLQEDVQYILVPAKDGFSDRENWFLSDNARNTGRSLATFEVGALAKYAREKKIEDLEIN
ncbi:MAG: YdcF family protein [Clostridia bacterium]